jgi:plasmid stabilization system protein ParE
VIVSFHRLAEQELNDTAQYYERESPGLGAAFLAESQRCCDAILEFPQSGAVAAGAVRRRLLQRFPYALLYTIRPNAIRILAVMNLKRRPGYGVGRL